MLFYCFVLFCFPGRAFFFAVCEVTCLEKGVCMQVCFVSEGRGVVAVVSSEVAV